MVYNAIAYGESGSTARSDRTRVGSITVGSHKVTCNYLTLLHGIAYLSPSAALLSSNNLTQVSSIIIIHWLLYFSPVSHILHPFANFHLFPLPSLLRGEMLKLTSLLRLSHTLKWIQTAPPHFNLFLSS